MSISEGLPLFCKLLRIRAFKRMILVSDSWTVLHTARLRILRFVCRSLAARAFESSLSGILFGLVRTREKLSKLTGMAKPPLSPPFTLLATPPHNHPHHHLLLYHHSLSIACLHYCPYRISWALEWKELKMLESAREPPLRCAGCLMI